MYSLNTPKYLTVAYHIYCIFFYFFLDCDRSVGASAEREPERRHHGLQDPLQAEGESERGHGHHGRQQTSLRTHRWVFYRQMRNTSLVNTPILIIHTN